MFLADSIAVLNSIVASLRRHPKRVTSSLAALLLGTGVTAFGVVPLAPDAADLPVRQVLEVVQSLPVQTQRDVLADYRFKLFRTDSTRSNDTFDTLLKRLNINDPAAAAFMRNDANARLSLVGRPGKTITVEADDTQALSKFSTRWSTLTMRSSSVWSLSALVTASSHA